MRSSFPVKEMWKFENKVWTKKSSVVPVTKRNHQGRLVSTPKELMQTLLKEYKDRLRAAGNDLKKHNKVIHEVQMKPRRG